MRAFATILISVVLATAGFSAQAQTEPDTIRVKEQLPTGLPGEGLPQENRRVPPPSPARTPTYPPPATPKPPAPTRETRTLKDNLYLGGNMGLNLFGRVFFVDVSPIVGYKITDKFSVGPGVVYQYISGRNVSYSNYGVKGFARFLFVPSIFAHAEHEVLNVPEHFNSSATGRLTVERRRNVSSTFVGGGYRQQVSSKFALDTMILFNLQNNDLTPYSNPVLRLGFYYDL
jgi:hypothetical protein